MSVCRIAICDDVPMEREMLRVLLLECDSSQLICEFNSGEELLFSQESFDLVFLDIYMEGMTGMDTARALQKQSSQTPIVFLTSSKDFAVESYEVHAFDYIVKPMQPDRLREVWERFRKQHSRRFLVVNNAVKVEKLPYEQMEFLESDQHYVIIHMTDGATLRLQGKLDDYEEQLNDMRFLRCHKSYLINMDLTKTVEEDFRMVSGKRVPYRKREKKQLLKVFYDYMRRSPGKRSD